MSIAEEVAGILNLSVSRVYQLLKDKKLPGKKTSGTWSIDKAEVSKLRLEGLRERERRRGRLLRDSYLTAFSVYMSKSKRTRRWSARSLAGYVLHWRGLGYRIDSVRMPRTCRKSRSRALELVGRVDALEREIGS